MLLLKIDKWTETAQENNVTRNLSKTALCIPKGKCQRKKQVVSTEILFQIYEMVVQQEEFKETFLTFVNGYNLSVESSFANGRILNLHERY